METPAPEAFVHDPVVLVPPWSSQSPAGGEAAAGSATSFAAPADEG